MPIARDVPMSTKEKIEVMQAFEDGKTIEFKDGLDCWEETKSPSWNWACFDYRVKQAPEYEVISMPLARKDGAKYIEIKALEDCLELIDRVSHAKEFWNIDPERYWALKALVEG